MNKLRSREETNHPRRVIPQSHTLTCGLCSVASFWKVAYRKRETRSFLGRKPDKNPTNSQVMVVIRVDSVYPVIVLLKPQILSLMKRMTSNTSQLKAMLQDP